MQQFFLARQPILDLNQRLYAFELLFHSASKVTEVGDAAAVQGGLRTRPSLTASSLNEAHPVALG